MEKVGRARCSVLSPTPLPQPSLLVIVEQGATAVGWEVAVTAASGGGLDETTEKGHFLVRRSLKRGRGWPWHVAGFYASHLPFLHVQWCGDSCSFGPPRTSSAATAHSTCASAQFLFLFPSLPFSFSSFYLSLSLLPAAASPKRLKLRRCSKYFPPPLSLSFSPSSNNNTKATNAKSVPRLCQLLLVGLVHSFFSPSIPGREGAGQPPTPLSFVFLKRKNAMVKQRFVEKKYKV